MISTGKAVYYYAGGTSDPLIVWHQGCWYELHPYRGRYLTRERIDREQAEEILRALTRDYTAVRALNGYYATT